MTSAPDSEVRLSLMMLMLWGWTWEERAAGVEQGVRGRDSAYMSNSLKQEHIGLISECVCLVDAFCFSPVLPAFSAHTQSRS